MHTPRYSPSLRAALVLGAVLLGIWAGPLFGALVLQASGSSGQQPAISPSRSISRTGHTHVECPSDRPMALYTAR